MFLFTAKCFNYNVVNCPQFDSNQEPLPMPYLFETLNASSHDLCMMNKKILFLQENNKGFFVKIDRVLDHQN